MPDILQSFRKRIGKLVDGEVLDRDFEPVTVDTKVVENTKLYSTRHRGSQRLSKGLFFTDSEKKETLHELRTMKMP